MFIDRQKKFGSERMSLLFLRLFVRQDSQDFMDFVSGFPASLRGVGSTSRRPARRGLRPGGKKARKKQSACGGKEITSDEGTSHFQQNLSWLSMGSKKIFLGIQIYTDKHRLL